MTLQVAFILTWHLFNLVSTKPALPLAKQPMLTSEASSLACPRQKPEWSSYGCKHHDPGTVALPEVWTPEIKHTYRFKNPGNVRLVKKTRHMSLPLLVQLFFLLCSVWMVCCCRRASCSGVTSLQSQSFGELTQRSASPAGCSVPLPATGATTGTDNTVRSLGSITKRILNTSGEKKYFIYLNYYIISWFIFY